MPTLVWACLALSGLGWAEEPAANEIPVAEEEEVALQAHAELRVIASQLSDFDLDQYGTTLGPGMWIDTRVRAGADWTLSVIKFQAELDVLNGTVAGDLWTLAGTPDARLRDQNAALSVAGVRGRKLSAQTLLGNTHLELGLVTSQWGLGVVANDGATEPMFGRADFGDRVLRLRATQLPNDSGPPPKTSWLYTGAVDLVVADDFAELAEDQQAIQGIFSVLGLGRRGSEVGLYGVYRQQWENLDGRQTQAAVVDGFVDATKKLNDDWSLRTAVESALITGRTNKSLTYNARDNLGVLSLGAAGIATLAGPDHVLQFHLLGAYASGDGSADDGISNDFTFDRDYGAGMVLFDEFGGAIEANTWRLLTDPDLSGQPPDSIEAIVTEGAFRKAAYLQPVVEVQPTPWSDVRAGVLVAFATAPASEPYNSYRAGGVPTNHLNKPADGRLLGTEFDWSLAVGHPADTDGLRSSFTLQGGHMIPGAPLQGRNSGTVHLVTAGLRASY
ncbi:MAG: hypothetical protein GWP91_24170 [Rhodobacterales bacterium]|nr:hypothetical protein [Rhodobacterales bacterium]